ncbi:hypothetical protein BL253_17505 [Pseudofrankia asymbiotica]|uniref:CobQ/CobB/MinD/ParA nucleotide binding domain-containing protein n=1 Tax=Pseudofrankia asymbiotica TaxID=1834516 RepID=A0A1V2I9F9_9ACTN|nr:hypothetical protein BL253_17505 [Pseudofrankia asymbiotica]
MAGGDDEAPDQSGDETGVDELTATGTTSGGGGDARPVSLLGLRLSNSSGDRAVVRRSSSRGRTAGPRTDGSGPRTDGSGPRTDGSGPRLAAVPVDQADASRESRTAPGRGRTEQAPRAGTAPATDPAPPRRPIPAAGRAPGAGSSPRAVRAPSRAPARPARTGPSGVPAPRAEPAGPGASSAPPGRAERAPAESPGAGWVPDVDLIPAPVAAPRGPWWDPAPSSLPAESSPSPAVASPVTSGDDGDATGARDTAVPAAPSSGAGPSTALVAAGDPLGVGELPGVAEVPGAAEPPSAAESPGAAEPPSAAEPPGAELLSATDPLGVGESPGAAESAGAEPPGSAHEESGWEVRDQAGYAGWLEPAGVDTPAFGDGGGAKADAGAGAHGTYGLDTAAEWAFPAAATEAAEAAAASARAWFGYGEAPPRPPFPPPGEAPGPTSLPAPVVYTPPPAPRPVPAPPVPVAYQTFEDDGFGGRGPFVTARAREPRSPVSLASPEAFAAAWWRGMELAGRGVLAPVPATRLGGRRVLVGGFGGGSGRTTVATGLGIALAARRGGRVVAVDACPDQGGPLADRAGVPGRGVGLRELALADPPVASLAEARRFLGTVQPSGLEVLPGLRNLTGPGLTPAEAAWAVDLLERLFPAVVIDGPPGWTQPVPAVLLARADTVVLTAKAGFTEAGCAQDALTALAAARADLPVGAVAVYVETAPAPGRGLRRPVPAEQPELAEPVHAVLTIPFDPSLADGAPMRWDRLRPRTQAAFEALAAMVDEAPLAPGASSGSAEPARAVGWEGGREVPWDERGPAAPRRPAVAGRRGSGDPGEDSTVPRSRALRSGHGVPAVGPHG